MTDRDLPAALAVALTGRAPTAAGWAIVARIKAVAPVWPPPVRMPAGEAAPSTLRRPFVLHGPLTGPSGCPDDPTVPCVAVDAAGWSCPSCGARTPMPEAIPGPRVPACECLDVVCLHRVGALGAPHPVADAAGRAWSA